MSSDLQSLPDELLQIIFTHAGASASLALVNKRFLLLSRICGRHLVLRTTDEEFIARSMSSRASSLISATLPYLNKHIWETLASCCSSFTELIIDGILLAEPATLPMLSLKTLSFLQPLEKVYWWSALIPNLTEFSALQWSMIARIDCLASVIPQLESLTIGCYALPLTFSAGSNSPFVDSFCELIPRASPGKLQKLEIYGHYAEIIPVQPLVKLLPSLRVLDCVNIMDAMELLAHIDPLLIERLTMNSACYFPIPALCKYPSLTYMDTSVDCEESMENVTTKLPKLRSLSICTEVAFPSVCMRRMEQCTSIRCLLTNPGGLLRMLSNLCSSNIFPALTTLRMAGTSTGEQESILISDLRYFSDNGVRTGTFQPVALQSLALRCYGAIIDDCSSADASAAFTIRIPALQLWHVKGNLAPLLARFSNLHTLKCDSDLLHCSMLSHCSLLTRLTVQISPLIVESLPQLASFCPRLEYLNLKHTDLYRADCSRILPHLLSLSDLRSLSLSCVVVRSGPLCDLLVACKRLRTLAFTSSCVLTEECDDVLVKYGTSLWKLSVCCLLAAERRSKILAGLSNLHEFEYEEAPGVMEAVTFTTKFHNVTTVIRRSPDDQRSAEDATWNIPFVNDLCAVAAYVYDGNVATEQQEVEAKKETNKAVVPQQPNLQGQDSDCVVQ